MTKICTKCKTKKELSDFSKDKRQKYGRRPECKDCEYARPSLAIKNMRDRVLKDKNYKGLEVSITKEDIKKLSSDCYFCNKPVSRSRIHRIKMELGYVKNNITKVHNSCHVIYHNKTKLRNILGQFIGKVGY